MADVKVRVELNKNNFKDFDKYNGLKKVESLSQSSPEPGSIHYGVLESSGSTEIVDENGKIYEMLAKGEMDNSNTNISVIANGNVVQSHIGVDSDYSRNEKLLTIDLGNRIKDLDTFVYQGYPYPDEPKSLATLLFDVLKNLRYTLFGTDKELTQNEFVSMLSDKYDKNQTLYEYLQNMVIDYPIIEEKQTYRDVISQFCVLGQMQMYIDDNDNIKFISARPKTFSSFDKAIYIPKKNMFSLLDYNVILKNKYDGVLIQQNQPIDEYVGNTNVYSSETIDLSSFTIDDFPYIKNDELYIRKTTDDYSLNYDFDYGTKVQNLTTSVYRANYIMSKYYYKNFSFTIPKKSSDNLQQTTSINPYLVSENSKSYSLIYEKTTGTCSGTYNKDSNKFTSLDRKFTISPEDKTYRVEEGNGALSGAISTGSVNDLIEIPDDDNSRVIQITESTPDSYLVKVKVLVSLERINIWYLNPATMSSSGTFEKYMPKSLTVSIYGSQRTIKFDNIDASTYNIENAKTTISLTTNKLLQKDSLVKNVKENILNDYVKGVSNGTITISCNDYYNKLNQKVVDWNKGEIVKVNDLVCFEDDKNIDGNQRYWKIKGRTFRKEGVPMIDLELEETPQLTLNDYSWKDIKRISDSGKAEELFSIGDEKIINLKNGETITVQIAEFNSKEVAENYTKVESETSITFVVKNSIGTSYMLGESINDWTKTFLYQQLAEFSIFELPEELQNTITVNADAELIWLLRKEFVEQNSSSKLPLFNDTANLSKGYSWWLLPENYDTRECYIVNANGSVSSEPNIQNYHDIIFGFYV